MSGSKLQDVLTAVLLLTLLHDLQELFQSDATVARDVSLRDDLIDVGLERLEKEIKKYINALVWASDAEHSFPEKTRITDTGIKIK